MILGSAVLVLMAVPPLFIAVAPARMVLVLEVMHIVAGLTTMYALTRWT